jgi:hypothetical protein
MWAADPLEQVDALTRVHFISVNHSVHQRLADCQFDISSLPSLARNLAMKRISSSANGGTISSKAEKTLPQLKKRAEPEHRFEEERTPVCSISSNAELVFNLITPKAA